MINSKYILLSEVRQTKTYNFGTIRLKAFYAQSIILISFFLLISVYFVKLRISLVPSFLEPTLIKYDWLTVPYFAITFALYTYAIFKLGSLKWWFERIALACFCDDTIKIADGNKKYCFQINDVKFVTCNIYGAVFPLQYSLASPQRYYKLTIVCNSGKYIIYSRLFVGEDVNFDKLIHELRKYFTFNINQRVSLIDFLNIFNRSK